MNLRYQDHCQNIPWEQVPYLLRKVGMSYTDAGKHEQSFRLSFATIFVFDGDQLIGFGRMLSDGLRQSAIYDVAVEPLYQGKSIGREIVKRLIEKTPSCNFILYASPGKEGFYRKLQFKRMKTGMALFANPDRMADEGYVEQ